MSHNTESVIKAAGYSAEESRTHAATAWRRYELTRNRLYHAVMDPLLDAIAQRVDREMMDQSEDRAQPRFMVAYFPDGKAGYGEGKWGVLRAYDLELYDGMFVDAADATAMAVKREKKYSEGGDY